MVLNLKGIISKTSSVFSLQRLISLTGVNLILPFYHTVSDVDLPHIKHLYPVLNTKRFREDLDFLLRRFKPVSSEELISISGKKSLNSPHFFLSFDDGLSQVYHVIAPILKEKGVPATFFLNTDFIDNKGMFYRLKTSLLIEKLEKQKPSNSLVKEINQVLSKSNIRFENPASLLKIRKLFYKKVKPTVQIKYNLDADKELAEFLTEFAPSSNTMVRPIEHFEWIASYPWMQSGNPTAESKKYYFSSVAKSFNYISCRLYANGRLTGFCLLKERDKNLSVCYLYSKEEDKPIFGKDILNWSIKQNMDTIFSMDKTFTNYLLQNKRKFIYIKNVRRPYLLPKSKNISADIFQFGDGDVVFT